MILPVKHPIITAYSHHAALLSILSVNEKHLPWIYCTYLQMICLPDPQKKCLAVEFFTNTYALFNCPWLHIQNTSREQTLSDNPDPAAAWIRYLDLGYYLYIGVDGSFIPAYASYLKNSFPHPLFVYGYDLDNEVFHIADFFTDGRFSFAKASFSELREAYVRLSQPQEFSQFNFLIRYDGKVKYPLDTANVKRQLFDYINSTITARYPSLPEEDGTQHRLYQLPKGSFQIGMNVYKFLLPELFQHFVQDKPYDSRVYPIIAEHKLLIMSFIHYLDDHGHLRRSAEIIAKYGEVARLAQVIKLNMLKYEISGTDKHRYIPHVLKSMAEMAFQEKACMEQIIAELY